MSLAAISQGQDFNSKEFFLGDWDLEVHRCLFSSPSATGMVSASSWKIKDGNETLYGVIIDEKDEERPLRIEFEGALQGHFLLAGPRAEEEEEDEGEENDLVPVFAFEFSNRSAGYFISQGEWKDEKRSETGIYQLVAMSPSTIILTLWLHDAQGIGQEVLTMTGKKFSYKPPQSFWQKFGMPLAMLVMIILPQILRTWRSTQAAQPAPTNPNHARQGSAGSRQQGSTTGEETEGPRFTEIKEESEVSSSGETGLAELKKDQ